MSQIELDELQDCLRHAKGDGSWEELAGKIRNHGAHITGRTLSRWDEGENMPHAVMADAVAKALNKINRRRIKGTDIVCSTFYLSKSGESDYRELVEREGNVPEIFEELEPEIDRLCEQLLDLGFVHPGKSPATNPTQNRTPMKIRLKKSTHDKLKRAVRQTGIPQINLILAAMSNALE